MHQTKRLSIVALAVLAIALAACSSSSPSGSTSTPPSSSTPSASPSAGGAASAPAAVDGYFGAVKRNDCTAAFSYLTDPLKTNFVSADRICQSNQASPLTAYSVGSVTYTASDTATVDVKVTVGGGSAGTYNDVATCKRIGGSWYLASILRR